MRASLLLLALLVGDLVAAPSSFEAVRGAHVKSDALVLDRNGEVIHERRVDSKGRRLDWIALAEISASLQNAVLLAEDKRFYSHSGIDWRATLSAVAKQLVYKGGRGASTISMQVAAQLDPTLKAAGRRGLWQKWNQMREARALEKAWTKAQILEAYLNIVSFRGELRGVAAATRGLFGKEAHGVNSSEAAVLASLIRSPNAGIDAVTRRACALSDKLGNDASCAETKKIVEQVLSSPYFIRPRVALAPHVATLLAATATEGKEIHSTLDAGMQRFAVDSLRHHLLALQEQNVHDGAVLVVDNASGEVLAYVGNSGELSSQSYVDAVRARRQAGSTLKPFLYGLAFEQKILTPASLMDDSPFDLSVTRGIYRPGNYDNRYHGLVSARVALASSLNIPAVRAILLVGADRFVDKLRALGIESLDEAEYYGPSLALGTADVSLWDLVKGFRALANEGVYSGLKLSRSEVAAPARRAISAEAAYLVSDILSDRESRSLTFGLENPLATRFWTAVKTGTSKDMRDNWCIGYSSRFTVGVWVGNFSGEPMWNVSGVSGAAPVWIDVMNYLHGRTPSHPRKPPEGVKLSSVRIASRTRVDPFVRGTETRVSEPVARRARHRILYPVPETIFALDPDIPSGSQRVFFEAEKGEGTFRWKLNGDLIDGDWDPSFSWEPRPGKFTLALLNEKDEELDTVSFEVRPTID